MWLTQFLHLKQGILYNGNRNIIVDNAQQYLHCYHVWSSGIIWVTQHSLCHHSLSCDYTRLLFSPTKELPSKVTRVMWRLFMCADIHANLVFMYYWIINQTGSLIRYIFYFVVLIPIWIRVTFYTQCLLVTLKLAPLSIDM